MTQVERGREGKGENAPIANLASDIRKRRMRENLDCCWHIREGEEGERSQRDISKG